MNDQYFYAYYVHTMNILLSEVEGVDSVQLASTVDFDPLLLDHGR